LQFTSDNWSTMISRTYVYKLTSIVEENPVERSEFKAAVGLSISY